MSISPTSLPIPDHFDPRRVGEVWQVPYQARAMEAKAWATHHQLSPAAADRTRVCLLAIDVQNTFCIPGFELFVGGRSGMGAVDDNRRLCEFIYKNLGVITDIIPTLDTHTVTQIFHPHFWVNATGEHPEPMTLIQLTDVEKGVWKVNPTIVSYLKKSDQNNNLSLEDYALHYVTRLERSGQYPLTIWPYHSILGGIGHALVSAFEEACFFHNLARNSQTQFEMKGDNPLTENYSVLQPEVLDAPDGQPIAQKNNPLIQKLLNYDAIVIGGQAKSHCVAWTIENLLTEIQAKDPTLAQKVYLLEDCTSPVVVPGVVDFTDLADSTFQRFAAAGMHRVNAIEAIETWPGWS